MNWEAILIFLIPLIVWILGVIFRNGEEEKPTGRPTRRNRDEESAPRPAKRKVNELDRFLEEARQRRDTQETRKPIRERVSSPLEELPLAVPIREAEPPRPKRRDETSLRSRPLMAEGVPQLLDRPGVPTAKVNSEPKEDPKSLAGKPQAPQGKSNPIPKDISEQKPKRPSPMLEMLQVMLKKPDNLYLGIVLSEIIGPPVSSRPHPRAGVQNLPRPETES